MYSGIIYSMWKHILLLTETVTKQTETIHSKLMSREFLVTENHKEEYRDFSPVVRLLLLEGQGVPHYIIISRRFILLSSVD